MQVCPVPDGRQLDRTLHLPQIRAMMRARFVNDPGQFLPVAAGPAIVICALFRTATTRIESAKKELVAADLPSAERRLLGLVADGVVERYA